MMFQALTLCPSKGLMLKTSALQFVTRVDSPECINLRVFHLHADAAQQSATVS